MLEDVGFCNDPITHHSDSNPQPQPLELTCMKKRRKRTSITSSQLQKLEQLFKEEPWPSRESKENLAEEIGMSPQFVNIWFQNKRARIKKESHDEETDPTASPQKSPRIKSHFLEKRSRLAHASSNYSPRSTLTSKDDPTTDKMAKIKK
uniref:Homeobox domain-containing protein n=1 Tax=Strigamia maritima TaxID=126957 RepID=T1IQQ5_STRMM